MTFATLTSDGSSLANVALVLAIGVAVVVAVAELITRRTKSARWQQMVWRVAVLSSLTIALAEWTGITTGLTQLVVVQHGQRMEATRFVVVASQAPKDNEPQLKTGAKSLRISDPMLVSPKDELATNRDVSDSTTAAALTRMPEEEDSFVSSAAYAMTPTRDQAIEDESVGAPVVKAVDHPGAGRSDRKSVV